MAHRGSGVLKLAAGLVAAGLLSIPLMAQKAPEATVESLKVAPGLQVTEWAAEPMLVNPTNIDIDARGRIWVAEGANYRRFHTRDEGDRILILEDVQHTGKADNYKVFVQDKQLQSPLGVCVLGNKVIVSQSPNVLVYTIDASGDKPVGPPQVLFTGFGGVNHDHGVHSFTFGPDGRLYFNCGNEGEHTDVIKYGDYVKGKAGQPVEDVTGSQLGQRAAKFRGHPRQRGETGFREGLVMSCNPDGSDLEVVGYDFRNEYENAVDSFGTVWLSDNDDDGNQGVTINYVMQGGDFGFTGPKGTSWQRDWQEHKSAFPNETRQEAHWHQRWPGVVPNLLNTGQGSPCGICVYEGDLLPEIYHGALLHCDAGPNVVRAYFTRPGMIRPANIAKPETIEEAGQWLKSEGKAGAGYDAVEVNIVDGHGDRWFRPDDISVAPDGAVYISDWYDPGVGGHNMQDTGTKDHDWHKLKGRIYRLTPEGYKPAAAPKLDLETVPGQVAALNSPNLARRYLGYTKLADAMKAGNEPAIEELSNQFKTDRKAYLRARALWLLARSKNGRQFVTDALKDPDSNIRITGIRAARRIKMDMVKVSQEMLGDSSPQVLRELCLAMQYEPTDRAVPVLLKLADKYDGQDRWYLEAFGIGCNGREQQVLAAYEKDHKDANDAKVHGIIWRLKKEIVDLGDGNSTAQAAPADSQVARPASASSSSAGSAPLLLEKQFKTRDGQLLPSMADLARLPGNAANGAKVFRNANGANCIKCHQIGDEGNMVGPPLTAIGNKLSKAQLYEAILYPSIAIEMGYETWVVKTKTGEVFSGLKTEETDDHITLKDSDAKFHDIPADQVAKKVKQSISLMPEGLSETMTRQELIDVVQYLADRKG